MLKRQFIFSGALVLSGAFHSCSGDGEDVEEQVAAEPSAETGEDVAIEDDGEGADELAEQLEAGIGGYNVADAGDDQDNEFPSSALSATPLGKAAPANVDLGTYWVFVSEARVHSAPDVKAPVVKVMSYGSKVTPVDKINGWVQVESGQFVRVNNLTDRATGFAAKRDTLWVSTPDTEVYSAPDQQSSVVGKLTRGERVFAKSKAKGWIQIGEGRFVPADRLGQKLAH